MKKSKKTRVFQVFSIALLFAAMYIVCFSTVSRIDFLENFVDCIFISSLVAFVALLAYFLQIFIHELGHLVFGLMTGYGFASFRFFSFVIVKINGKFKSKRMTLVGTAGQCLMTPPEPVDGKYPYKLYHLGGVIMNAVVALVAIPIYTVFYNNVFLSEFFIGLAAWGFYIAITNGVPMNSDFVCNDGGNVATMSKSEDARRAIWVEFKINGLSKDGMRLKDMPEEYFEIPNEEKLNNHVMFSICVFAQSRLMDEHKFEEAKELSERLLSGKYPSIGIHSCMLTLDKIYCDIVLSGSADVSKLSEKTMVGFIKAMRNNPSVIRTQYAIAKVIDKDEAAAEQYLDLFEKIAPTYPSSADVESERELIEIVKIGNNKIEE
ncbi:MAG: hypothetical protein J1E96_02665 [Ruminococcus sp.]|nr:hypothetical protein [Ruminococcus sp.]